jgi:hypothetical protein
LHLSGLCFGGVVVVRSRSIDWRCEYREGLRSRSRSRGHPKDVERHESKETFESEKHKHREIQRDQQLFRTQPILPLWRTTSIDWGSGRTHPDISLIDSLSVDRGQGGDAGGSEGSETHLFCIVLFVGLLALFVVRGWFELNFRVYARS